MPSSDPRPTQQMLDNLDLLLDMDLLSNEADWKIIEKLKSFATADLKGHGKNKDKEDDHDEDEADDKP